MKKTILVVACSLFCAMGFATEITESQYARETHSEYLARKALFAKNEIWTVFDESMSAEERNAMEFLYASMSIADMADNQGSFFLKNVRQSLLARKEMPWGEKIPDDIFRHFVLPVRVNNENLDAFRTHYYKELRDRVQNLSLYEAALEVNHWCHEHVAYTPSDSRTSAPMSTVKTGRGRCGEESTLVVAAMRTVGIPARQVYTPRWAHTDDNHAWVEVWVNGKWYFIGACEPEPVLNLAWFNAPAARAMLMHTRVFGDYYGPEDVIKKTNCFTEINVIGNYVPVRRPMVKIVDVSGNPVADAMVEFKLYNYAEFYTVAQLKSNKNGEVALTIGLGDMVVWASKNGRFGFGKLCGDSLAVVLNHKQGDIMSEDIDIVPPKEGNIPVEVTEEQIEANKKRLAREDSIREAYLATFMSIEKAKECGYDEQIAKLLHASQGNWMEIKKFIDNSNRKEDAVAMLRHISAKDLRDTPASYLQDYLTNTPHQDSELFAPYVLSPRISGELITPFRSLIKKDKSIPSAAEVKKNPYVLVAWIKRNVKLADEYNPVNLNITPAGVLMTRYADRRSRDVFFVAACRAMGVPARIESVTGQTEYWLKGEWQRIDFEAKLPVTAYYGSLQESYEPTKLLPNPQYYRHFTLSKINGCKADLLNFEEGDATELGADASWMTTFSKPYKIEDGYYLLTSGTRMASGKVLAHIELFNINRDENTTVPLLMRKSDDDISVIGNIDAEAKFRRENEAVENSILSATGRGYFILVIAGTKDEPTTHATRALVAMNDVLNNWNRKIVTLFRTNEDLAQFDKSRLSALDNVVYGVDADGKIEKMIKESCNSGLSALPIVAIADTFGRVVYFSQGYNTSLGEQINRVINKL